MELSKGYSPFLSFNVKDMDGTVLRLLSMGAELDGPIKHPPQGKVCCNTYDFSILLVCNTLSWVLMCPESSVCRLQQYGAWMVTCWGCLNRTNKLQSE